MVEYCQKLFVSSHSLSDKNDLTNYGLCLLIKTNNDMIRIDHNNASSLRDDKHDHPLSTKKSFGAQWLANDKILNYTYKRNWN